MTTPRSRTARQLTNAAHAAGWTVRIRHAHGVTERSTFGPPRADGTRPRTTTEIQCESEGVRLRSPDRTRNAAALIVTTDGKSWTSDGAWGWDTGHAPRPIDVRALLAYLKTQAQPEPTLLDPEGEKAA